MIRHDGGKPRWWVTRFREVCTMRQATGTAYATVQAEAQIGELHMKILTLAPANNLSFHNLASQLRTILYKKCKTIDNKIRALHFAKTYWKF